MTEPCPFCTLPAERIVDEDERFVVIRDAFPVSPGHLLVIPKRHVESLFDLDDAEMVAMLRTAGRARETIERERRPDGYNLGVNVGEAAGQTVMHVHLHLIPRFAGDVEDPRGGIRHCIPGRGFPESV